MIIGSVSFNEAVKIEDKDLLRFLVISGRVPQETEVFHREDENITSFYSRTRKLKMNSRGVVYPETKITQYITYDKKTKKVRKSANVDAIEEMFLSTYFKDIKLVKLFILKLTLTFCKKVFERKIKTVRDIIKYHRSYTYKDVSLNIDDIYGLLLTRRTDLVQVVKDTSNSSMVELSLCPHVPYHTGERVPVNRVEEALKKYEVWRMEQSEKIMEDYPF